MDKIFLIDKPTDWTSFDVVARIRGEIRKKLNEKGNSEKANSQKLIANSSRTKVRVGHAGTLDPFATGLLIVLTGKTTKEQDKYMKLDKEYLAALRLGYTSTTGDPEGEITPYCHSEQSEESKKILRITPDDIEKIFARFKGQIEQTPPAYSAIKVDGQRAYKLAREGKEVKLKPRKITIYELEVISYDFPELKIRVKCSSGTYIRTLGEDIGKALGCGAYLTALRRTKIGDYNINDALSVEKAFKCITKDGPL